ncbi:hypothetical protein [Sphingomonas vulcanisoli]|uniref:hypothetical protein n=1 Tax=Sphingomonas vulcanisoli TaxID=1658060 RepID=UPI00141F265C|nr:hypothetical protein [Sphingomonas vulcanisoli]
MTNWGWTEWLAWAGVVVPLASLAWAAVMYVRTKRAEVDAQRFEQFFKVMELFGSNSSIASKMAAAFELRKYPQYKEVIIRLCEKARVEGDAAEMLRDELRLTAESMRKA